MLRSALRVACAVTLFTLLLPAWGVAQPADRRTLFTFSGPVALPGVTLPAGTYMFRLLDPSSRLVQVLSADGTRVYATFFSLSAERFDPADRPEVRFMETAANMPAAIRTWWYPGERRGFEFIYPREQARRLAQGAREPVLTTAAETATVAETETAELARVDAQGVATPVVATEEPTPATPVGEQLAGEVASPAIAVSESRTPVSPVSARDTLPTTASTTWTLATVGIVLIAAGAGYYAWRRRGRLRSV